VCLRGCNDISDQNLEAFLVDLGLPKEKAKKLIEVSKNTDRYAQDPRDVIYIFEEDKLEPEEGYYLYETIRYPPEPDNPHQTVN
jgi:hypothetical protein